MISIANRGLALLAAVVGSTTSAAAQADRPAEEVYKNVQVLKGVPASTFMNTMFFQRYALGVSCSYCHAGSNWASDEKPTKALAREMMRMVMQLNNSQFDSLPMVSCMTCHRGSPVPVRDIPARRRTIDEMLAPRADRRVVPALASVTVASVLAKYLAAQGGAAALAKVATRVTTGQMITAEGSIVPFEESFAFGPARFRSVRHFGGSLGDFITGFDGTQGWNSDNRGITPQQGEARAQLAMNAALAAGGDLTPLYQHWQVDSLSPDRSPGDLVLSAVSALTGRTERLAFDAVTGLLVRRTILTAGLFGTFATDIYFEKYQAVDGVMIPTMVSEFTPDFGTVRNIATAKHNVTLPQSTFTAPQAPTPR